MHLTVKETKKNQILHREEVLADLTFEGKTPSRLDILAAAAKDLKADQGLIIIKKIITNYGEEKARITLYKYDSEEVMQKLEPDYLKKKHKPKAGKEEKTSE